MRLKLKYEILKRYGKQIAFAKACGKKENWISRIINCRQNPTKKEKELICSKLDMRLTEDLFDETKKDLAITMRAKKKKITYTLYVDERETPENIKANLISRRIKTIAVMQGETMVQWARELGVTRQAIYHVIEGRSKSSRIRVYIEKRLGQEFWGNNEVRG